jgi:hypothetical protein
MRLRIMQIILFFPCCVIDGVTLLFILFPIWVICGIKATTRESLLYWLFIKTNK